MNKIKFIPVLAVVALLSACGNNRQSVKAPKFAKEGQEVAVAKFVEDASKAFDNLDIFKEDRLGSKVVTSKASEATNEKLVRGKKTISESKKQEVEEYSYKLDAKSFVAEMEGKYNVSESVKNATTESESSQSQEEKVVMQQYEEEGKKYFSSFNISTKQAQLGTELTGEATIETVFDNLERMSIYYEMEFDDLENTLAYLPTASAEDLKDQKFYENGNIFTMTYSVEESHAYPSETDPEANIKVTYEAKQQYVLEPNAVKVASAFTTKFEISLVKDTMISPSLVGKAGDVYENVGFEYFEAEAKDAKLSLKPIKTEGYTFMI